MFPHDHHQSQEYPAPPVPSRWPPCTDGTRMEVHVDKLERVQRKAARLACVDYRRRSSVTDMLKTLGWNTLQQRRTHDDVTYSVLQNPPPGNVYKCATNLLPTYRPCESWSAAALPAATHQDRCITFKRSFYSRTVRSWNALPRDIVTADSVSAFNSATSMLADRQ